MVPHSSCKPAALYHDHGRNIELSDNDSVAERVMSYNDGIVFTAEPVPLNCVFQVTVLREKLRDHNPEFTV